jgi:hypothetical protein
MTDEEQRARERCRADGLDPDYVNGWGRPNWQDYTDAEVERFQRFMDMQRPLVERVTGVTFTVKGDVLQRLRDIQSEWGLGTLQEALEHAIEMCPERYGDPERD